MHVGGDGLFDGPENSPDHCLASGPRAQRRLRLLYKLLSQESDAAKILIIKHADPPVADIIKEIANTCGRAKKELDLFHEKDRHLNLEMTHLPEIEQKTRAAIESTVTKQLLFSSGKTFEVRFLLTQAEAMNYAAHLRRCCTNRKTT